MTELLYLEDFGVVECDAIVQKLDEHDGKMVVVLDKTCFYPKGGGQDFDRGTIQSDKALFQVEAVFFEDGEVKHIGDYNKGKLQIGDKVRCSVETERRQLNSRIHSAGHLLDMAVRDLGWQWHPGKGAHYPDMDFVEYSGDFDVEHKQRYIEDLQDKVEQLIARGSSNTIAFMTPEKMTAAGAAVPDNIPKNKPSRAVFYDDFPVPCGGTHVENITEIGRMRVTNIKRKSGNIRVSYSLA